MSIRLAGLWRHPIKSLGAERLDRVTLEAGRAMPHDRLWAVAHGASAWDPMAAGWAACGNFLRIAHVPALAAVTARYDPDTGMITLTHPERPEISATPATAEGARALLDWAAPLAERDRPGPYRLAHAPGGALTDAPYPWVSIMSLSSLRALGEHLGQRLDPRRFRGNLWVEGAAPWEEEGWEGQSFRLGSATLRVTGRIDRCRATEADPETGQRNATPLVALRAIRGHIDFGVFAEVTGGGELKIGDALEAL